MKAKNFFVYLALGYVVAETLRLYHYSFKYSFTNLPHSKGSWVNESLNADNIPIPAKTLMKMNNDMMEYAKKDE
jgi:hypothetical protein